MEEHTSPFTTGANDGSRGIHIFLQSLAESQEMTVKADCTVTQVRTEMVFCYRLFDFFPMFFCCLVESRTLRAYGSGSWSGAAASLRAGPRTHGALECTSGTGRCGPTHCAPECKLQMLLSTVEGLDSLGLSHTGPGLFSLLQSQMERQLLSSPEMMQRVLGSGFVQSSLCGAGSELIRTLILSNPQIQQLLQTNPELEDGINSPEVITQVLELVRNPDLIKEILKSEETEVGHGRQQRNKSINGQFNFPPRTSSTKPESGVQASEHCTDRLSEISPPSTISTGMQSLLEQISSSPGLVKSLLSGPHVKSLLQCLSHNPELAAQMLLSHPLLSENPQLQQQLGQQLPLLLQQMQSPELLSAMLNPKAVEALLQIQQGLQTLASEALALIPAAGFGNNSTFDPESVLNKPRSSTAVSTATAQQQQFVQQMLQTLANSDLKDLDPLSAEAFEDR